MRLALTAAVLTVLALNPALDPGCAIDYAQDDTMARVAMREIHLAQRHYLDEHGRAATLAELGTLAWSLKFKIASNRYTLSFRPTPKGYELRARPQTIGPFGYRSFYTDQTGIIRYRYDDKEAGPGESVRHPKGTKTMTLDHRTPQDILPPGFCGDFCRRVRS